MPSPKPTGEIPRLFYRYGLLHEILRICEYNLRKDMIVHKVNNKMSNQEKGRTLYDLCWYPAASYSPGTCPSKYHPRKGA